ncbi:MAG: hypothetical protein E5W53_00100 [Mesorhizobium sp.]|nr:MAG: hypothetical protein E5W53_00100 [Mesorhizobium sp.]
MSEAPLSFELSEDQANALRSLAGGKGIRISGYVDGTTLKVDNIAINAGIIGISSSPFKDGMAPFIACNGPLEVEK